MIVLLGEDHFMRIYDYNNLKKINETRLSYTNVLAMYPYKEGLIFIDESGAFYTMM